MKQIKIFKHKEREEVYILNPPYYAKGIRLSDGYWANYPLDKDKIDEKKNLIIDNSKFKIVKNSMDKDYEIKLLVPKFDCKPHFILSSVNGNRIITKQRVYSNVEPLGEFKTCPVNLNQFVDENYKKVKTIKLSKYS